MSRTDTQKREDSQEVQKERQRLENEFEARKAKREEELEKEI